MRHGQASALAEVRRTIEHDLGRIRCGPMAVLHAVMDRVVDDYVPVIDGLDNDMAEIEDAVFAAERPRQADDPSQRIFKLKREVLDLYRNTEPLLEPLSRLAAGQLPGAHPELGSYFRDVEDHLKREVSAIAHVRDLLSDALDANLAQVTVRQNDDMRTISAWLAIGGFPTVVGAIYGMNFDHMPELGTRFGYYAVLAVMAAHLLLPLAALQEDRLVVGRRSVVVGELGEARGRCPGPRSRRRRRSRRGPARRPCGRGRTGSSVGSTGLKRTSMRNSAQPDSEATLASASTTPTPPVGEDDRADRGDQRDGGQRPVQRVAAAVGGRGVVGPADPRPRPAETTARSAAARRRPGTAAVEREQARDDDRQAEVGERRHRLLVDEDPLHLGGAPSTTIGTRHGSYAPAHRLAAVDARRRLVIQCTRWSCQA